MIGPVASHGPESQQALSVEMQAVKQPNKGHLQRIDGPTNMGAATVPQHERNDAASGNDGVPAAMISRRSALSSRKKQRRQITCNASCADENTTEELVTFASKADREAVNPSLPSLVTPWMALVILSVVVCAVVVARGNDDGGDDAFDDVMNEFAGSGGGGSYSSSSFIRNLIGEESSSSSSSAYKHKKDIFSEEHKPLHPLDSNDYTGFLCATLGLMVAAGGGIGGGGILVPIYILVMGFSPKHAIPLSNITVFGGACANTYLNSKKRHPLADRPLVDWDLILVMEPLTIAGALLGAFLNKLLPEGLLVVMLVLLLSFTANNTLKKAFKMYGVESRALREQTGARADGTKESELTKMVHDKEEEDDEEAGDSLLDNQDAGDDSNDDEDEKSGDKKGDSKDEEKGNDDEEEEEEEDFDDVDLDDELQEILEAERFVPKQNLVILVTMFVVVLFVNVMKGGGAFTSPLGIKCGSMSFWLANLIMLGWIFAVTVHVRKVLVKKWEKKEAVGYQYVEGDIQWDGRATIIYPAVCCLAGFFAGMFGVGGGIVKGPLMLAMGVHPKVSSASSACMILFTSFTATTSFVVFGLLIPDYAMICFTIGFLATLVGQIGLFYLMKKFQRNSYIAFSIGFVVLLSAFLMTIQSLYSMTEEPRKGHGSGGICGNDH